jgi:hypothetical protein
MRAVVFDEAGLPTSVLRFAEVAIQGDWKG